MKCTKCGKDLGGAKDGARVAFICGSVMGDEYVESYYYCDQCKVYSLSVYHDRFSGEDSVSVQGPLDPERAEAQIEIIRRCPDPGDKRCRCDAHMEYFGGSLD